MTQEHQESTGGPGESQAFPIYPNRRAARKHKPLPKRVRAVLRSRSPYRKIERKLKKRGQPDA